MPSPSRRYLEQHEDDLLGDVTLEILDDWAKQESRSTLLTYARVVLGTSREIGVTASYLSTAILDTLDSWLRLDDPNEGPQYLHASLLFTDEAGAKLQALAEHNERLRPHLQMLRQARAVSVQLKPLTRIRPGRALGLWGAQRLVAWRIWLLACHPPCVSSG